MKKFLQNIWNFIKNVFQKATDETKVIVPIAVEIVNDIKAVTDSGADDVIISLLEIPLPGATKVIIDKVHAWIEAKLPIAILSLNSINLIANITDPNTRLVAIINYYKALSGDPKAQFFSGLAAELTVDLSDGKLSIPEAYKLAKEYYDFNFKK
jgi:hypothetical protein